MDVTKQKAIEAAGWKVGDAADFLGMSNDERQLLDTRIDCSATLDKNFSFLRCDSNSPEGGM